MKHISVQFLKMVLILVATIVALSLIWLPQTEGRAVNLDLISIYSDPLIIYVYIASIPFFLAIYKAFKLLMLIEQSRVFSQESIKALNTIKYCAITTTISVIIASIYIRLTIQGDDPAGPTMLGFLIILASIIIATAAGVLQKLLRNGIDLKTDNDFTV